MIILSCLVIILSLVAFVANLRLFWQKRLPIDLLIALISLGFALVYVAVIVYGVPPPEGVLGLVRMLVIATLAIFAARAIQYDGH